MLTTVVMVRAVLMTSEATMEDFVAALKKLNLVPSECEKSIPERVESVCQIKRKRDAVPRPAPNKREGLTFADRRDIIVDRLSQQLRIELEREANNPGRQLLAGINTVRSINASRSQWKGAEPEQRSSDQTNAPHPKAGLPPLSPSAATRESGERVAETVRNSLGRSRARGR